MNIDTKQSAELLGSLSLNLNDTITRFIFELMGAINKGDIKKAQDLAKVIEADLRKIDTDLTSLSKALDIQPTHNGIKVLK